PDYAYYADRVAQTLARVTEVFGWDAVALLKGTRSTQRTLGETASHDVPMDTDPAADSLTLDSPVSELGSPKRRRTQSPLTRWN
ncbi:MAG: hypothetical protein LVQ64_01525, partial [Thermoplasmatales archaeon]|nr:hypothetical protein [Thermoplasmatales archaeon]